MIQLFLFRIVQQRLENIISVGPSVCIRMEGAGSETSGECQLVLRRGLMWEKEPKKEEETGKKARERAGQIREESGLNGCFFKKEVEMCS